MADEEILAVANRAGEARAEEEAREAAWVKLTEREEREIARKEAIARQQKTQKAMCFIVKLGAYLITSGMGLLVVLDPQYWGIVFGGASVAAGFVGVGITIGEQLKRR